MVLKKKLGDDLIKPTKIYVKYVLPLIKKKKYLQLLILQVEYFRNLENLMFLQLTKKFIILIFMVEKNWEYQT